MDYIKLLERKPDILIIHTGTNDLPNRIKEVRNLLKEDEDEGGDERGKKLVRCIRAINEKRSR